MTILIPILIFLVIAFNIFVYLFGKKVETLELAIINLFKRRNNEVTGIYEVAKDDLVRAKEIFKEYFNLKRREFGEDSFDASLEQRILTYKQMHNEINFIFETCEKHNNLQKNPIYSYLKEGIYNKSGEIGKNMRFYETINKKFLKYKFFSKFTIVGLFY